MVKTWKLIIPCVLLASCSLLNPVHNYEKALYNATAQKWVAGIKGGGSGLIFRVKFYQLEEEIHSDTLWINNTPLDVEITRIADTTYISSFYVINQENYGTSLAADTAYSGILNLKINEKNRKLNLKDFEILPAALYP